MIFMTVLSSGIASLGMESSWIEPRKLPLAFLSYRWVRYQERRLLSIGERMVCHVKRRLRIAITPQSIR
jgi:hypothetical protein